MGCPVAQGKQDSSFSVEKEAKRLSSVCVARAVAMDESFLVLFFKKEHDSFPPLPDRVTPGAGPQATMPRGA